VLRSQVISVILALGCFACVGAGLALAATCDGGYSLILFGGAIAALGALIFRTGAWATLIPFALMALTLAVGGWYGAMLAGCWH